MNRAVLFGIATLVVIIGLSLLGSEKQAVAGFGCHGCAGVAVCPPVCGGGCGGMFGHCGGHRGGLFHRCGGRQRHHCGGLFGRRHGCAGVPACPPACCDPCPPPPCGCAGGIPMDGGYPMDGGPTPALPDAPPAPPTSEASFSTITFVK